MSSHGTKKLIQMIEWSLRATPPTPPASAEPGLGGLRLSPSRKLTRLPRSRKVDDRYGNGPKNRNRNQRSGSNRSRKKRRTNLPSLGSRTWFSTNRFYLPRKFRSSERSFRQFSRSPKWMPRPGPSCRSGERKVGWRSRHQYRLLGNEVSVPRQVPNESVNRFKRVPCSHPIKLKL